MIYVSGEEYAQVEYLINQSIQGNHVLFDLATVRNAFESGKDLNSIENSYEVEHHIERIILMRDLAEKKAYLEALDPAILENVIRTYFCIVENNLLESQKGSLH